MSSILFQQEIDKLLKVVEETCLRHPISLQEINEIVPLLGFLSDEGWSVVRIIELIKNDPRIKRALNEIP